MAGGCGGLQLSADEDAGMPPTQGEVGGGGRGGGGAAHNCTAESTVESVGLSPKLVIAKLRCWLCHQSFSIQCHARNQI